MRSSNKKGSFTSKVLQRLDRLAPDSIEACLHGLIHDRGFLENVFNTIREAIVVIDDERVIRFSNQAAHTLLGIDEAAASAGAYLDKYLKTLRWDELIPRGESRWWSAARREIEVFYPEHRFLSFYVMPLAERSDAPRPPLTTLIFSDVTEATEASEQHAETQKVKAITQLAAGVAHELGNPLNSLGIHLQLLKRTLDRCGDDSPDMLKAREHLQVARQEIQRLDTIVRNFLSAVRPVPLQRQPLDLQAMLQDAITFMRTEIENRGIQVRLDLPASIPLVLGDKDQLLQAAYNIIKNAIQAMPDGGTLAIAVAVDDVYVHIRFTDTGCGFDSAQISQLLQAYYTTKTTGNGLGLMIIDRIVRAHGGELTIEGSPGKGAAFTISLPRQERMVRQLPLTDADSANHTSSSPES